MKTHMPAVLKQLLYILSTCEVSNILLLPLPKSVTEQVHSCAAVMQDVPSNMDLLCV